MRMYKYGVELCETFCMTVKYVLVVKFSKWKTVARHISTVTNKCKSNHVSNIDKEKREKAIHIRSGLSYAVSNFVYVNIRGMQILIPAEIIYLIYRKEIGKKK